MDKGFSPLFVAIVLAAVILAALAAVFFIAPETFSGLTGGPRLRDYSTLLASVPANSYFILIAQDTRNIINLVPKTSAQEQEDWYKVLSALDVVTDNTDYLTVFAYKTPGSQADNLVLLFGGNADQIISTLQTQFNSMQGISVKQEDGVYHITSETSPGSVTTCFQKLDGEQVALAECSQLKKYVDNRQEMAKASLPADIKLELQPLFFYIDYSELPAELSPPGLTASLPKEMWSTASASKSVQFMRYGSEASAKQAYDAQYSTDFESKMLGFKRTSTLEADKIKVVTQDLENLPTYSDYSDFSEYVIDNPTDVLILQGLKDIGDVSALLDSMPVGAGSVNELSAYAQMTSDFLGHIEVIVYSSRQSSGLLAMKGDADYLATSLKESMEPMKPKTVYGNYSYNFSWEQGTRSGWTTYTLAGREIAVKGDWVVTGDYSTVNNFVDGFPSKKQLGISGMPTNYPVYLQTQASSYTGTSSLYLAVSPRETLAYVKAPKSVIDFDRIPKEIGAPVFGFNLKSYEDKGYNVIKIEGNVLKLGALSMIPTLTRYYSATPITGSQSIAPSYYGSQ